MVFFRNQKRRADAGDPLVRKSWSRETFGFAVFGACIVFWGVALHLIGAI